MHAYSMQLDNCAEASDGVMARTSAMLPIAMVLVLVPLVMMSCGWCLEGKDI